MEPQMHTQTGIISQSLQLPNKSQVYKKKVSFGLGVTHIVLGSAIFILQILGVLMCTTLSIVGAGLWSGVLFIVTGVFGVRAGQTSRKPFIITFMILSIISACFAIGGPYPVSLFSFILELSSTGAYCFIGSDSDVITKTYAGGLTIEALIFTLAFAEFIISIISASFGCHGLCSCCCWGMNNQQQQPIYYSNEYPPQAVLIVQGGATCSGSEAVTRNPEKEKLQTKD